MFFLAGFDIREMDVSYEMWTDGREERKIQVEEMLPSLK
jgi:hypothetical protein